MANINTTSLMDLLFSAAEGNVPAVQDAIRAVAVGDWTKASRLISYAADATNEGDTWGDEAAKVSAELRAKADHFA
jgi:hypothetical protein